MGIPCAVEIARGQRMQQGLLMVIVHLMASPFFGGPERQMLGLALHLSTPFQNVFLSFPERGLCRAFLDEVRKHGLEGIALEHNYPRVWRAVAEVANHLRRLRADVLTCSGYKPDLLGCWAARRVGIPVVSVSHGWTSATWKVRLNEALDRWVLRSMDRVVCVSEAQAVKVRAAQVPDEKIVVIRNAVGEEAFAAPDPTYADRLARLFPQRPRWIVGAAGRLSPEKGFDRLVAAAALVRAGNPDIGFVVFGDGPLKQPLGAQIARHGLQEHFILAGFRTDVGRFLPHLDLAVIPSYTEGLPVILLEEFAAGVPVVATAVGGIPEVIADGKSGWLVPAGDDAALAQKILAMFARATSRQTMGQVGRERVRAEFMFAQQARKYEALFEQLVAGRGKSELTLAGRNS